MLQTVQYSVIDNNIPVSNAQWVVGIARKPRGKNPEHALLLVEGRNSFGQAILRRYDLFDSDSKPGIATISTKNLNVDSDNAASILDTLLAGDDIYVQSWGITDTQADNLHLDVLQDSKRTFNYQVSGDKSIFAKSTSHEGHSCFSWAREKLLNLNDPRMVSIQADMGDFVVAQTSRHIKSSPQPVSGNCLTM